MAHRNTREDDGTGRDSSQDAQMRNAVCFMLLVCLGVLIVLLTATLPNHSRNRELVELSATLRNNKVVLHERNERLRKEIKALRSDPFYIEAVARRKYKMVRAGEVLIELEGSQDSTSR